MNYSPSTAWPYNHYKAFEPRQKKKVRIWCLVRCCDSPDVNKQKSPKEQAESLAGSEVEANKLNLRFHNTADAFPRPVLGSFEEKYANELGKFFDTSTGASIGAIQQL